MFISRNIRGGRLPTVGQIAHSTVLGTGRHYKVMWVGVGDNRQCDFCYNMDGQTRPVTSPFYPGGVKFGYQHGGRGIPSVAQDHNCRCQEVLVSVGNR